MAAIRTTEVDQATASREETVRAVASEIQSYFAEHADSAYYEKQAWVLGEGYDPYGLAPGLYEALRNRLIGEYAPTLGLEGVLDVGDILWKSGKWEDACLAIDLAGHFKKEMDRTTFDRLSRWFDDGLHNWVHCDMICSQFLSYLLGKGTISLDDLVGWRGSLLKYKRRAVPVTMRVSLKKPKDLGPMLAFLVPLLGDPEPLVHRMVGSLLSDAWRKQPAQVEAFLAEWKDACADETLKRATAKMPPDIRALYEKSK